MSSLKRILSSRANGARSRGPQTPEGKKRSSQNALRHGLLARCIVLGNESREGFDALMAEYLARFGPVDAVELGMIEEMVAAFWRIRRAWAMETRLLDSSLENQPPGDELSRLAGVFTELSGSPQLNLLNRYETRLHRIYQRALHNLLLLRTFAVPNEPSFNPAEPDEAAAPELPALPPPEPGL